MTSEEQRASEQPTGAVIVYLLGFMLAASVAGLALAWRWGWI
jgi:hypothetical protein